MFNRLNPFTLLVVATIVGIGGLGAVLLVKDTPRQSEPLIVHCAAALREPMEEIIPLYEQEKGIKVEVRYGESQGILTNLELSKQGDVFLPADDSYIADGQAKDWLGEVLPVAKMDATLAINPSFGETISTWAELIGSDRQIAIANPNAAAISRLTKAHLSQQQWNQIKSHAVEMGPVTQVANAVKTDRNIAAGIIWDAMLSSPNYQSLKAVKLKELEGITAQVKIATVKSSTQPAEALAFARFVSASCSDILRKHGFVPTATPTTPAKNEPSQSEPTEILLYAGSMLRPAIEETIKEFEKRENVKVKRVYNGCGILVSQMKIGERPDVYFSCDPSFMNQVNDLFEKPKVISNNQLVIAVKKGNPFGVKSLKDLGHEGLKIGVGHEQQCALGAITEGVLIRTKTLKAVQNNVVARFPSGDLLVNQLRAGSLDAVVAYISNVKPYLDELEAITVEEVNCQPAQPIAAGKSTAHPDVVKRLIRAIESAESKQRFEQYGFGWELGK